MKGKVMGVSTHKRLLKEAKRDWLKKIEGGFEDYKKAVQQNVEDAGLGDRGEGKAIGTIADAAKAFVLEKLKSEI